VHTNRFSLKYLLDQWLLMFPQHSWVSKLFSIQFTVEFKPGRQSAAVDALSRRSVDPSMVHAQSIPDFALLDQFRCEAESLPDIIAKKVKIATGSVGSEWALIDGLVVPRGLLFLLASVTAWP
jgi:hypothetical protein